MIELPNVSRATIPYVHHFITFCCRFLVYSNDNEGNPFQEELIPLASSSPALLHSMAALVLALREPNKTISGAVIVRSDSTLGTCLLLCVYEVRFSVQEYDLPLLKHLQAARDLIPFRGSPRTTDYLTRFFSLLDVPRSLSSGRGPLIQRNY
jgi:hypothetical protein